VEINVAENPKPQAPAGARKPLIAGSTLGAGVLLVAALIGLVNYFGYKYHWRWDWTSNEIYTLSEKSRNVVQGLTKDVEAVVFMRPGGELYAPVRELLARYQAASPRIRVRMVDPDKNLAEAQQLVDKYKVSALNVVVFDAGGERRVIEATDLADYDYSGMQMGEGPRMTDFKGEQRFTGALLELQEGRKPKILVTTGHGEADLDSPQPGGLAQAQDFLGRDNFQIEEWASLGAAAVPAVTDVVLIPGPTSGFVQPELDALAAYLAQGGRLIVMIDPVVAETTLADTGLGPWLENYGVRLGDDIVVDPSNPLPFFGADTIFASAWGEHPISKSLREANLPAVFALARSVSAAGAGAAGFEVTELVKTSAEGWGERDLTNLRAIAKDPTDSPGPVSLAVVVGSKTSDSPGEDEVTGENEEAGAPAKVEPKAASPAGSAMRLVVFGDSDFATNAQLGNAGNGTLLADTVNWLAAREQALGIAAKTPEQVRLNLTGAQISGIFWIAVGLLPLIAVSLGIAVYLRRRR
jgi:gliding motility-associatede transport system auxiliary component